MLAPVCIFRDWCHTMPRETFQGFAAMGDSLTVTTGYTWNWVPWLVDYDALNFGPGQTYDVAEPGATTSSLLSQNQDGQVANLVANGSVNVPILMIGGNDMLGIAPNIYNGTLSGSALTSTLNGIVNNICTATDTVLAAHPAGFILADVPDITYTPEGSELFPDPQKAKLISNATDYLTASLKSAAASRNIPLIDLAGLTRNLVSEPLVIGGVTICSTGYSPNSEYLFQDATHPGAVGHAIMADLILDALDMSYGTTYPLLTDQEILTGARLGSSYAGETFSTTADLSQYVFMAPEPSTLVLLAIGAVSLLAFVWRKRTRASA